MDNQALEARVNEHYGKEGLLERILTAASDEGLRLDHCQSSDFSAVSEFHIGGRKSTIELAKMAQLSEGDKVLDVGCGLGGPARTLVEEFGVLVDGIDLTSEFCAVANELTRITGLSEGAKFSQGNALNLNCESGSYDVVWTQQSCMNIEDKRQMFAEVNRVLKPGGAYVFQEVLAGVEDAVIKFPVPWDKEANMSYLWDEKKIKNSILKLNMVAHIWKNATEQYLDEYRILAAKTADVSNTPVMGVHLMLGGQAGVMRRNVVSNLSQGLIAIYQGVFKKEK